MKRSEVFKNVIVDFIIFLFALKVKVLRSKQESV